MFNQSGYRYRPVKETFFNKLSLQICKIGDDNPFKFSNFISNLPPIGGRAMPRCSKRTRSSAPTSDVLPGATTIDDHHHHKRSRNSSSRRHSKTEDTSFSVKKCLAWFKEYTTVSEPDVLGPEGMEKFCADIGVDPENVVMLVIAYKMGAKQMGYFTQEEWLKGLTELQCDSVQKLQNKLEYLRSLLNDPCIFKAIYRYSYDFARLWVLVLSGRWCVWCAGQREAVAGHGGGARAAGRAAAVLYVVVYLWVLVLSVRRCVWCTGQRAAVAGRGGDARAAGRAAAVLYVVVYLWVLVLSVTVRVVHRTAGSGRWTRRRRARCWAYCCRAVCSCVFVGAGAECETVRVVHRTAGSGRWTRRRRARCWACCCRAVCSCVFVGAGAECETVRVVHRTAGSGRWTRRRRARCWACCCRAVCSCVFVGAGAECETVRVVHRTAGSGRWTRRWRARCWACCCRAVCSCVFVGAGAECETVRVVHRTAGSGRWTRQRLARCWVCCNRAVCSCVVVGADAGAEYKTDSGQRSLDAAAARALLGVLLPRWPLRVPLATFLQRERRYRVVNRDQWCNILEFSRTVDHHLAAYDADGAWPVMLDEFVEWLRAERANEAAMPPAS
ncbi:unnamed protein product [Parnassius apollo]|uniref:Defective in cullin neddylation protein n=1 Tax=Parnassius apollo TaxID=110799 RepID=A0A8S3W193_PARAO|nr:unnamed protein product [Parnassius apollo]